MIRKFIDFFQIAIHNAENWLGLDEEGGGVGGTCDVMMMPRLPDLSPPVKTSNTSSGQTKACRSETPDSAVDVQSAADSPNSTASDFNVDVGTSVAQSKKDASHVDDQVLTCLH